MKFFRMVILLGTTALIAGFFYWYFGIREKHIDVRSTLFNENDKDIVKVILNVKGEPPLIIEKKASETNNGVRNNDEWIIRSPIKTDADKYVIQTLIKFIKSIKMEQTIQYSLEKMSAYGLDDPQFTMRFYYNDEIKAQGIDFGIESLDGKRIFVKIIGDNKIYSIPIQVRDSIKLNLTDVRNKYLCEYTAANIRSLTLVSSVSSFIMKKESDGWYLMPERIKVSENRVHKYIGNLRWVRFVEVVEEVGKIFSKYGLDRPKLVLVLELQDEPDFSFIVGNSIIENDEELFYATRSSDNTIFKVKSNLIYGIVKTSAELTE